MEAGALHRLARLYWYTVEFGLAREDGELKIYGAGIVSSFGESRFSLESPEPHRLAFDLERVLRTEYRSDCFQKSYFVIDGLPHLLDLLTDRRFRRPVRGGGRRCRHGSDDGRAGRSPRGGHGMIDALAQDALVALAYRSRGRAPGDGRTVDRPD